MNLNKTEIAGDDGTVAVPLQKRTQLHELSVLQCHMDHVTGDEILMSTTSKVIASVLCVAPSPNVTLSSILSRASILFPPKPMSGYCDFCKAFSVKPILMKHYHTRMSAELPLSTKIRPTSFPVKCTEFLPMLALMMRGSLLG